jgi:hypothetical protein
VPAAAQAERTGGLRYILFFLLVLNPVWSSFVFLRNALGPNWGIMLKYLAHANAFSTAWFAAVVFYVMSFLNVSAMGFGILVGLRLRKYQPRSVSLARVYFIVAVLGLNILTILLSSGFIAEAVRHGETAAVLQMVIVFGGYIGTGVFSLIHLNSPQVALAYPLG